MDGHMFIMLTVSLDWLICIDKPNKIKIKNDKGTVFFTGGRIELDKETYQVFVGKNPFAKGTFQDFKSGEMKGDISGAIVALRRDNKLFLKPNKYRTLNAETNKLFEETLHIIGDNLDDVAEASICKEEIIIRRVNDISYVINKKGYQVAYKGVPIDGRDDINALEWAADNERSCYLDNIFSGDHGDVINDINQEVYDDN